MGQEIERKFLVQGEGWREQVIRSLPFRQGYLSGGEKGSVRVRIEGEEANINIKSATLGISRLEYQYPIPLEEARELLAQLCDQPQICKTRHFIHVGRHEWEIDVFEGENAGLIVAEIELSSEDEAFERPPWLGDEVSADPRYYNVSLVHHPYQAW